MNPNQTHGGGDWQNIPYGQQQPGVYPPPYSTQNMAAPETQNFSATAPAYGFETNAPVPSAPGYGLNPVGYTTPYGAGQGSSAPLPYPPTPVQDQKGIPNPGYGIDHAGFQQNIPPVGFYTPINNPPYDHDQTEPKYGDYEEQRISGLDFSEKTIRRAFIRKVYSILTVQLLVAVGFIALFLYNAGVKEFTSKNPGFLFAILALYIITLIVMACCEGIRRKAPHNFIFLGIFTLASGVMLGVISANYNEGAVLLAGGVTVVVCLSLTIFSFQTKIDFTRLGGMLFVLLIVLILFGFMTIFLREQFPVVRLVYACCGALLFSFFLIHDTQLMIGGDHKYSISPEEYIFAALTLYLDIINIFLYLLRIFGNK